MPTSIAGSNACPEPCRKPGPAAQGFTLLELLIVLVLIGVGSTLAITSLGQFAGRSEARSGFERTYHELQRLRAQAIHRGVVVHARIDLDRRQLGVSEGGAWVARYELPTALHFVLPASQDRQGRPREEVDRGELPLFFFPDGSASDARFVVRARHAGGFEDQQFRIVGLSGKITRTATP